MTMRLSPLVGTFRTCRVALTMSVDGGKADLALGRIGAFLFDPMAAHEVEFYVFDCLASGPRLNQADAICPSLNVRGCCSLNNA